MMSNTKSTWPIINYADLKDTLPHIHMWTQMIGKVRLVKTPWINHSWHVTLYVSATGLTTGSIPFADGIFQVDLDLINHQLIITTSAGKKESFVLQAMTVAEFYQKFTGALKAAGVDVKINAIPNEIDPAIPFADNHAPGYYNSEAIHNFWQALVRINNVFTDFRAGFAGKCSPVHFFWGAFDLAVTRFSGREAPKHPGGAPNIPLDVMQEAYSHEVSSCGFWPGSDQFPHPAFYAYCYPTPNDFSQQKVNPPQATFNKEMGEFILTYDAVQKSSHPEKALLQFMQTTYDAAATTGNWDKTLQCDLSALKNEVTGDL